MVPGGSAGIREPVTVMTFAPEGTRATNMPGMPAIAQAYASSVNAKGGADGHELRVLTCNEHNTTSGAAACARRAVAEGAVAVVGSYSQNGRAFMAPLEAAGIPYIGGYGVSEEEFTSYLSYPVNGGQAALLAGNGRQLADSCRRVSLVRPDTVAGDELPVLLNTGLAEGNGRPSVDVKAAEDATEYLEEAARARDAAGDEKGCVTAVLGERTANFFDSFRRLPGEDAADVRISSVLSSVGQPLIDRTGGAGGLFEGAYMTGWYPDAGDARWGEMRQVIKDHAFGDDRIDPADAGVQTTWIAYTVLTKVIEALDRDTITPGALSHALDTGVGVDTGGLTPGLRWRFEDMLGVPGFPRIVNPNVTFQVVRDGRLVAERPGFVDVGGTMSQAPMA
ncbi:ABC transporter substrate-binding protein [Streptomyces pacificus]|uniref:ABC transporter substrate-binding protein n=1 Tax=Streptomyces pacificus TaxID=2705029 RepID=A0A6A0AZ54_9ACTN|nr:ABC transporter substrate-binding protein [Streptomyces pacificus]